MYTEKFLPIGSVVMLEDSTKRLMIAGVKQVEEDGTEWDYCGCLFPEGMMSSDEFYLFNTNQIETLFFIGLQDGESLAFLRSLDEMSGEEPVPTATASIPRPVNTPTPAPSPGGGFCTKCGGAVSVGAKFCKGCGAKI